ncbi:pyrimidine operon attenuation protein/uracil phosphoribosyltransferase [Elusimicrobium simillimum]|uniref:bifunctional pyr operon transcriptional regulator/uracil phosphoribosyltransferase PyrR n=1 Tax=Elusimicrobium simillimum TaxID=3143438 RepID=UPI003C6F48F5
MEQLIADAQNLDLMLDKMAAHIVERHAHNEHLALVGIKRRGIFIAKRLNEKIHKILGKKALYGELDIKLYCDDLSQVADNPVLNGCDINFDMEGKTIVLVDDVLYTGRTLLTALNALLKTGKPGAIELAVVIDRGHHEIPVAADYAGDILPTAKNQVVHVHLTENDGEDNVMLHTVE